MEGLETSGTLWKDWKLVELGVRGGNLWNLVEGLETSKNWWNDWKLVDLGGRIGNYINGT